MSSQPWMRSARFDSLWILLPPFFAVFAVFALQVLCPGILDRPLSAGLWLFAIVGIDVAHVYSTVFRSYLQKNLWRTRPVLLIAVPLLGFALSCSVYRCSPQLFWRSLAYLAVFHFVRQPYGLMRFYQRKETSTRLDKLAIYTASLYPLVLWHVSSPKTFGWFMEGDLLVQSRSKWVPWIHATALGIALAYVWQEVRRKDFNLPKNMIILGTALAFGCGIILWNSDVAFTLTNVISHGVPYMALIWIYHGPASAKAPQVLIPGLFLVGLFALAYVEEGLWDAWVWADHPQLFPWFSQRLEPLTESLLMWIVPLLALPQLTHYVLDGFLWRLRSQKT